MASMSVAFSVGLLLNAFLAGALVTLVAESLYRPDLTHMTQQAFQGGLISGCNRWSLTKSRSSLGVCSRAFTRMIRTE